MSQPYRLHRGKAAHQPTHRAEHALRGAVIAVFRIMRIADEAAIAGGILAPAHEGSNLAVELADRGADQGDALCLKAKVVYDQARGEIVAAVDDNIYAAQRCLMRCRQ